MKRVTSNDHRRQKLLHHSRYWTQSILTARLDSPLDAIKPPRSRQILDPTPGNRPMLPAPIEEVLMQQWNNYQVLSYPNSNTFQEGML